VDVLAHIVTQEAEPVANQEMVDVVDGARAQVVDGDDLVAPVEQKLAHVRPKKSGSAGDDDAHRISFAWKLLSSQP
jgi:hypothetical protein